MNNDDSIWHCIGEDIKGVGSFCAYKVKSVQDHALLCTNEYNLTGDCNRDSCPLANSQYGTIREFAGKITLHLKTVERAHLPSKMWENIELPKNRHKAFEIIDDRMVGYYKDEYIELCKKKYMVMRTIIKRARKQKVALLQQKSTREHRKITKRELRREAAALQASRLNLKIENALLDRLQNGFYGELYDVGEQQLSDEVEESENELNLTETEAFNRDIEFKEAMTESEEESYYDEEEMEEDHEVPQPKVSRKRTLVHRMT